MNANKILCVGTTPAAQRAMVFRKLTLDSVNRAAITVDGVAGKSINVAKVLKVLGEHPIATGFLGGDRGENLRQAIADKGIESDFVTVSARTRQCITVIDETTGMHTELVEESVPVTPPDFEKFMTVVRRQISNCRAVVMSGTIASGGPADFYFNCVDLAKAVGAISVVDAQGTALTEALKAKPDLVKPNRAELAATTGRQFSSEADLKDAMRELYGRGTARVVVTAGKEPVLAFDGKTFWQIVPPQIKAINPIGSGDAFTAGMISRLLRGDDLGEACRWGAAAGAANALTPMPGELNYDDVIRLVDEAKSLRI
ncbi:MAG TPA: hexose kinase [Verrucomicrobiae bacterium]|nr:hexose kinase [Verrucomicrobiae bacterium]